ncbi:hypothetical protein [Marinimicrobium sp. ABcell2]|uniref:hypothetical protein n=1 Tax=Marinimicrobium sp. ABcell2 TaxID=3069751 RepID=UPI0027B52B84|nr:hypothetical protein [Marinimicrobium sp. ABcell2]MDQ2075099.1 hypothetical protein [Marinimicrobium sp. ABcell2]
MIAHNHTTSAPDSSTDARVFERFCALYRERRDALELIRQLVQLIKAAQRHRGMSMALLGGNTLFKADFDRLQLQLQRRLLALQAFARDTQLLTDRERENLQGAWATISHDWQQDSVIDNYELHCHLIEQLLSMVTGLSRGLEQPVSTSVDAPIAAGDSDQQPNRVQRLELLHFTTRLLPSVVEQIGRIRALASYAAAIGFCDSHHDGKLRYVIQNTRVNNEKLRHQTRRLDGLLGNHFGPLGQLKSYELKLMFLLNMVETDVLTGEKIHADSNRLFSVATDIIDVYLQVVEAGIQLLSQWQESDFEQWLQNV